MNPLTSRFETFANALLALAALTLTGVACAQAPTEEPPQTNADVRRKLSTIIIPKFEFNAVKLPQAIDLLQKKTVELDPAKTGVKIVLKLDVPRVPDATTSPDPFGPPGERLMSVSITNVPLIESFRYVAGLAGLKFRIEDGTIVVMPESAPEQMVTREWKISRAMLSTLGKKAAAQIKEFLLLNEISFPVGAAVALSPDQGWLVMTNNQENLDRLEDILSLLAPPAVETPKPGLKEIRRKLSTIILPRLEQRDATLREALDFLQQKSIELDTSEPDSAKRGVTFVLEQGLAPIAPPEALLPTLPGFAPLPPETSAPTPDEARTAVPLVNVPLIEALRYVTSLANVAFKVEPEAVVIVPTHDPALLLTREWALAPAFVRGLARYGASDFLKAQSMKFPPGSSVAFVAARSRLIMRNTETNLDYMDALVSVGLITNTVSEGPGPDLFGAPNALRRKAESLIIPSIAFRQATLREIIQFLREKSVALDPQGTGVNLIFKDNWTRDSKQDVKVTFACGSVSVWDAANAVSGAAGLTLVAEPHALAMQVIQF